MVFGTNRSRYYRAFCVRGYLSCFCVVCAMVLNRLGDRYLYFNKSKYKRYLIIIYRYIVVWYNLFFCETEICFDVPPKKTPQLYNIDKRINEKGSAYMIYTLHICRLKELDRIYIYRVVVGGCTKTTPIIDVT